MTDRLDLPRRYRDQLEALLRAHLPGVEVWAYGSRVNGRSHDGSDLDLVLRGPDLHEIPVGQVADFAEAVRDSTIPFLVEARDWARLPERFQRKIERGYVVIVGGEQKSSDVRMEWRDMPFSDAVAVNPSVRLERGKSYPFVDMAAINVGCRSIRAPQRREFQGGGTRFQTGDTLMARITPCLENGKIARYCASDATEAAHGSTEFIVIRGRPDITDTEYAYYLTQWEEVRNYAVGQMTGTSGRQRVPVDSLDHLMVPVPPLPEQRAIAHVLGILDDKVELNRRMNETLEGMARALFQSWFVDFDPVRAKAALRRHAPDPITPPLRGSRGDSVDHARAYLDAMDPAIAALFPDRFVDSALGAIPAGWEVKTLGEVVEVVGGTTPSTKVAEYWDGGKHNWATPRDLSSLSTPVLLDTERKITDAGLDKVGSGLLPPGTLLLSSRAPIGYLAISEKPVAVNQGFIAMPPGDMASSQFLLYWCSTFHDEIINHANGSTFLEISKGNFRRIPLVLPDKEVMTTFDNYARQFHQRIVSDERESRALATLRDALLPRLVSGALRVGHPTSQAN